MGEKTTFRIAVDITLGNKNHTGIATAAFVQNDITDATFKANYVSIESLLFKVNLNDTFTGGIPCTEFFGYLSIVLHLQQVELPVSERRN